jgi:dihydrofolate reductase
MELIVAVSQNGIIGNSDNNSMLWNIPEDLSMFYNLTKNNVVIMGNNTYKSLPNGKLKNRINVVLTKNIEFYKKEIEPDLFFIEFSQIWELLERFTEKKIFVIGGSSIYRLFFPFCSVIHYTLVNLECIGNVSFPFSIEYIKNKSNFSESEWKISKAGIQYKYITFYIKN